MLDFQIDPEAVNRIIEAGKFLPVWLDDVTSSTAPLWGIVTLQYFFSSARALNSREETREEMKIISEERESNRKRVKSYASEIESKLWRGLDILHDSVLKSGAKTIQIHHGNDILLKAVGDFRRDYHHGFAKVSPLFVAEVHEEISAEIESDHSVTEREETLKEIARCARMRYLDGVHKRAGYSAEVEAMEDAVLPYSDMLDIVEKLFSYAQKNRLKRIRDEKLLAKRYAINILNVVKIAKVLIKAGKK